MRENTHHGGGTDDTTGPAAIPRLALVQHGAARAQGHADDAPGAEVVHQAAVQAHPLLASTGGAPLRGAPPHYGGRDYGCQVDSRDRWGTDRSLAGSGPGGGYSGPETHRRRYLAVCAPARVNHGGRSPRWGDLRLQPSCCRCTRRSRGRRRDVGLASCGGEHAPVPAWAGANLYTCVEILHVLYFRCRTDTHHQEEST